MAKTEKINFSQAMGLEDLPQQLNLGDVSDEFRSLIWYILHAELKDSVKSFYVSGKWAALLRRYFVFELHRAVDEIDLYYESAIPSVKEVIYNSPYNKLFDFLLFLIRRDDCPAQVKTNISAAFRMARLGSGLITRR